MDGKLKVVPPRYQQIAVDMTAKIVDRHYQVGEKVYTRSELASHYGVSSETARRAISMLADMDIVATTKGSGVIIKSYENAVKFIRHYNDIETLNDLKRDVLRGVEQQIEANISLKERIKELVDKTDRFRASNPFMPFELIIDGTMRHVGKTISEMNFWHNTTATIIAIRRGDKLMMSPGPYAILMEDDVIYFVGDEDCYARVTAFLSS